MPTETPNERGEWVPAIPEPLRVMWWLNCPACHDERFWTVEGYRGHYALRHILALAAR